MSLALDNPSPKASRDVLRATALLGVLAFVVVAVAYVVTTAWDASIPRAARGVVVGHDFLNFWMYGRATALPDPQRFYDPAVYMRELTAFLWPDYPGQMFSYPPTLMLLAAPFGALPYMPALLVWTALGMAVLAAVARQHLSDWRVIVALLASPAALSCLTSGQSSLLTAAMLITIFAWLERRPIAAGVLIGLLTIKPQLGLLFPVMLIAGGYWRTFASAAVTAVALAALTTALFGAQVWIDFIKIGMPAQNDVLAHPEWGPFAPTIFVNVHALGLGSAVATAAQAVCALMAAAAVIWMFGFRRSAPADAKAALFLACSLCVTPYFLVYDTLALCFAGLILLDRDRLDTLGQRLVQLVYWLPFIQITLGFLGLPGAALIAPAFAIYLLHACAASSTQVRASGFSSAPRSGSPACFSIAARAESRSDTSEAKSVPAG